MNEDAEVNVFACLNFIRNNAQVYAKAKADRVFLEEYRKTKKSLCMKTAEAKGISAINAQERDAYADPEYMELLNGLRAAVEEEERLRWLMVAAQAKISAWQTIEATRRLEAKTL